MVRFRIYLQNKNKKDELLRAPIASLGIIRRESTRKKELIYYRDKHARHEP